MKNYLKHCLLVATPILLFMLLFGIWVEPLNGDLTRTGQWSEREYGANVDYPAVKVIGSHAKTHANAWVLGDSFSDRNIWQSLASERTEYQFKTFNYGNCIDHFVTNAIHDPTTNLIVIETIERDFINRFGKIQQCQKVKSTPLTIGESVVDFQRPAWPLTMNILYLAKTAFNTLKTTYHPNAVFTNNRVINTPIKAQCAKFSHLRQNRFLYYEDDEQKSTWTHSDKQAAAQLVLNIQKRVQAHGKQFLFILVPDKSSVYNACLPKLPIPKAAFDMNEILTKAGVHTLNLHVALKDQINVTTDVYEPNNTHWSLAGYRFVANRLSARLNSDVGLPH